MKKNFIIVLFVVVFSMLAAAQNPMHYGDGCYLYNPISLSNSTAIGDINPGTGIMEWHACYTTQLPVLRGYEYILSAPTTIYGIAVTATTDFQGTAYLCKKTNSSISIIDSIKNYSNVREYVYEVLDSAGKEVVDTVPCMEYLFPEPYTLSDTIYVGIMVPNRTVRGFLHILWDASYSQKWIELLSIPDCYYTIGSGNMWGGVFPIIQNGCDSCPEVHDIRFTKVGNSAAIAQWDVGGNHQDWQLCYGPQGFTPDTTQAIATTALQRALTGLSDTAHYDVYIRAHCHCCSTDEWTSWTGPFDLCLSEIGIDEAAAPEVTLSPNPTTGKLTVGCEAEIKEVELYDMQGRMISGKWKEGSGKCVVLDLTSLPAGSYILVAHTTKGVATRTVEKR